MVPKANRRRVRAAVAAPLGVLVAAVVTGCPQLEIEGVSLSAGSTDAATFSLFATVTVTEDDPAVEDDGDLSGGRGLLGVWLPEGWTATAARLRAPGETAFSALTPVPDGDGHFPPPFPWVPGAWTAFASPCANVAEGAFEYAVELDVEGPAGATAVVLGVATAIFDDAGSNGGRPVEVAVDLAAGTASVRAAPAAPASAGLAECAAIPYGEPAGDGDGCACAAPGSGSSGLRLLPALLL